MYIRHIYLYDSSETHTEDVSQCKRASRLAESQTKNRCCVGVKHLTDLHVLMRFTSSVLAPGVLYDDYIHVGKR